VAAAREAYRASIRLGLSGDTQSITWRQASLLAAHLERASRFLAADRPRDAAVQLRVFTIEVERSLRQGKPLLP
jgi:hypothetical protein